MLIWGTPNTSIRKTRFPGNKSEMSPEQPKDPLLSICKKKAMRVERGRRGSALDPRSPGKWGTKQGEEGTAMQIEKRVESVYSTLHAA